MLIQDYLDICDPVLTFDRFMGEIEDVYKRQVLDDTHDNGYHLCHFPHASAPAAQTFHIPSSASETDVYKRQR